MLERKEQKRLEASGLSEEQKQLLLKAIGDGSTWPSMTADPAVNATIDDMLNNSVPWRLMTPELQQVYKEEAAFFEKEQLPVLSPNQGSYN